MNFKKSAFNLSVINGLRYCLGFLFQILLARHFGLSKELDCLFIALTVFTFAGMIHLFMTSLFIPVFNEIRLKDEKDGFIFADVVLKWSVGAGVLVALLFSVAGEPIVRLVASGFDPERIALTTDLSKIIVWALIFHSLSITIIYILNALYNFVVPAITGIFHPVLNVVFLLVFVPVYGIKAIAIAALVANFLQAGVLFFLLKTRTLWQPTLRVYHEKMPSLIKKSSKMTIAGFVWDLREIVSRNIASHLPEGSVALLAYSEKFILILFNLAVNPLSRLFYSKASELIAGDNWPAVRSLFDKTLRTNLNLIVFATSGVFVFLAPLLSLIFEDSKFSGGDIQMLANLVVILLVYSIAHCCSEYFTRVAYAMQNTKEMLKISLSGILVFFAVTYLLSLWWDIYGIAASFSLTQVFVLFVYYFSVGKPFQIGLKDPVKTAIKLGLIAGGMILMGLLGKSLLADNLLRLLVVMPVWSLMFLLIYKWFLSSTDWSPK